MDFLERDLEEIIYTADRELLNENGLCLTGKMLRQVRIGNYGVADLVCHAKPIKPPYDDCWYKGEINVIELKNKKVGVSTFFQALNYLKGVQSYLEKRGIDDLYNYRITLIGRYVDLDSSFCYLGDFVKADNMLTETYRDSVFNVDIYTYDYDLQGLKFHEVTGYNLQNKGF
jgi:hypothetical protein